MRLTPGSDCRSGAELLRCLQVLALSAVATTSQAATFNYLPAPIDVSPGVYNAWTDVDVSASVPAGATGVIVQWVNPSGGAADLNYGVRMKGSTDNWAFDSEAKDGQQGWLMTGVNAARAFQVFAEAAGVQTYLVGYTMPGVKFFVNRIDKSTVTTASWVDVNIAADTGSDTAIGAIFHVDCQAGSSVGYGLRKKGSTDNRLQTLRANMMNLGLVGVDSSEAAQQQVAATTVDLFLVGYVTSGAVFFTNAIDKSTATTGSYQPVDITNDVGAGSIANGAFVEIQPSDGTRRNTAIRPNGSAYDYYAEVSHQFALVGVDVGDVFQQKIELNTMDLYLTGYSLTDGVGGFRVKSGSYVGTGGALSITGVGFQPDVVIVDGVGGGLDAAIKTSTMGGANSKQIDNGAAFDALHITSLDPDGFSVGTDIDVNQLGSTYYWVAFKAAPGAMKVGTYAGLAVAQNVTGVGFTPDYVIVMSPNASDWPMQRSSLMPANFCLDFAGAGYNNSILNTQPNGFGLGTHDVAGAGTTFHYVAWANVPGRIATGSYAGNNADFRNITGVGFWPEYVILDRSTDVGGATGTAMGNAPAHKTAASGVNTDSSTLFNSDLNENDNIQALQSDGFQVGTRCRVNGNGSPVPCNAPAPVSYYWVAFGPHTAAAYYRSAGTNAANLNVSGRTVTISGSTATFSGAMPANVGIGDVLQYQVTGTFYLAFIRGRTSDTAYSVVTASGGAPQPAVGGTAVGVYRAYTSLSRWQALDENDSLDDTVENFDTAYNLLTADAMIQLACYKDGPMDDSVNVDVWTTGPQNYIRIFTPVGSHQVGTSQRHTGVAGTGFRLAPVLAGNLNIINLNTGHIRIEGLEIDGSGVTASQAVRGINVQPGHPNVGDIRIDSNIIHDLHTTAGGLATEGSMGILDIHVGAALGPPMTITNNLIYDITNITNVGHIAGIHIGSRATSYVQNNTILRINNTGSACAPDCGPAWGMYAKALGGGAVTVIAQNNYVGNVTAVNPVQVCYGTIDGGVLTQSFNVSSDATAGGTSPQINKNAYATYFQSVTNGSENLHLTAASSLPAMFNTAGMNLSASFPHDVDGQIRTVAWDIGADEFDGTTAVKLMSFGAVAGDREVSLAWRTGSELDNLGFHVYRGASAGGPWSRLTKALIPGLGSSAVGKAYSFQDSGLTNGARYFYRLEDVDAASVVTSHGPVSAVPLAGAPADEQDGGSRDRKRKTAAGETCPAWVLAAHSAAAETTSGKPPRCTRHGDPEAVSLVVLSRDSRQATLELRTGGFYALHEASGVRAFVPGFDFPDDPKAPALPLRRALVEAVVGRKVALAGVRALEIAAFPGLVPSVLGSAEMQLAWDGTVRAARRTGGAPKHFAASVLARLLPAVFQGETKSAALELSPLRFDAQRRQIVLARKLRLRLLFTGREAGESGHGSRGRRRAKPQKLESEVVAQLFTTGRGLYAAPFEQLFPGERRGVAASELRLQRLGEAVAFHVEPDTASFGPGGRLYFFADAAAGSTAYSPELAFELVGSRGGLRMPRAAAAPSGAAPASAPLGFAEFETNRFYQPGLLDAVDPWLWEAVAGGATRTLAFTLTGLDGATPVGGTLEILLQGASESGRPVDHHLRVSLNDVPVGEAQFAGKRPYRMSLELPAALAREGTNQLAIANVADTGVTSLVFVDRFSLDHTQAGATRAGRFEGSWSESGAVTVASDAAVAAVLDVTDAGTNGGGAAWLTGHAAVSTGTRFAALAGRRYVVATAAGVPSPRVVIRQPSTLRAASNQADYLLIGPSAFLEAAEPLIARRGDQGLSARAVAAEEIYDAFGHGEPSADAIRSFLAYAFHSWARPSPRYVVLLGDASYDPRNFMGSSPKAPLPAHFVKTSYLWTASDPLVAAVNGDDTLPDVALGRLPAASVEEATRLVAKLLAWEESAQGLSGPATLVADDPDLGGDFEANVADIAHSFLADRSPQRLLLRELGAATRPRVQDALDSGLSFLSYVGHGGAAVWASENVWNSWDAASLQAQSRQPLLLTMNCLNGYFVAPAFDSLAESLVKPDGRGAIAAISPSGLSLDAPAHEYHRALMAELTSGQHARLGDAFLAAQTAYGRTGLMPELLSIYHLFGDPGTTLRQDE